MFGKNKIHASIQLVGCLVVALNLVAGIVTHASIENIIITATCLFILVMTLAMVRDNRWDVVVDVLSLLIVATFAASIVVVLLKH